MSHDDDRLPVLRPAAGLPSTEFVDPRSDWPIEARDLRDWLLAEFGPGDQICDIAPAWIVRYRKDNTRRTYARHFRTWCTYTRSRGSHPLTATWVLADTFARWLENDTETTRKGKARAPRTRAAIIAALTAFYHRSKIKPNPFADVERPQITGDTVETEVLSDQDRTALITTARDYQPRSFALVMLLYTSGIRISEALDADVADLRTDHRGYHYLHVQEKGRDTTTRKAIPVETWTALHAYLNGRTTGPLFVTGPGERWTQQGVYDHLGYLGRRAQLSEDVALHAHVLRAQHITDRVGMGHTLESVRRDVGHKSQATTQRYVKIPTDLATAGGHDLARGLTGLMPTTDSEPAQTCPPGGENGPGIELLAGEAPLVFCVDNAR